MIQPSNNPAVTIIVPVYNGLPYFSDCLDSLMAQSFCHDDMEVILVDDHSTDGSSELCDDFAAKDPMFKVIHQNQSSGGAGVPRNVGIQAARGDYLFFLDDDDRLGPEAIERMVRHAAEWQSDILYVKMFSNGSRSTPTSMFHSSSPDIDIYDSYILRSLGPWKLFRKSFLDAIDFSFDTDGALEDAPVVLEACLRATRISVAADYDYYCLVERSDGKNTSLNIGANDKNNVYSSPEKWVRSIRKLFGTVSNYGNDAKIDEVLLPRLLESVFDAIQVIVQSDSPSAAENLTAIWCAIKPYYRESAFTRFNTIAELVAIALLSQSRDPRSFNDMIPASENVPSCFNFSYSSNSLICKYSTPTDDRNGLSVDIGSVKFFEDRIDGIIWTPQALHIEGELLSSIPELKSIDIICCLDDVQVQRVSFPLILDPVQSSTESYYGTQYNRRFRTAIDFSECFADNLVLRGGVFDPRRPKKWALYLSAPYLPKPIRFGSHASGSARADFSHGSASIHDAIFLPHLTAAGNMSLMSIDSTTDSDRFSMPRFKGERCIAYAIATAFKEYGFDFSEELYQALSNHSAIFRNRILDGVILREIHAQSCTKGVLLALSPKDAFETNPQSATLTNSDDVEVLSGTIECEGDQKIRSLILFKAISPENLPANNHPKECTITYIDDTCGKVTWTVALGQHDSIKPSNQKPSSSMQLAVFTDDSIYLSPLSISLVEPQS